MDSNDLRPTEGVVTPTPLDETIAALRDEIRGLRSAGRMRAVIEQAKGVLVERHGISLEEAFDRLRAMSQEHNVRLVEVAATVVGVAVPEPRDLPRGLDQEVLRSRIPASPAASRNWLALQKQPDVRAGVLSALIDSVAGAASHGDEAAQLLAELLASQGVAAVTLYRCAVDESLRLVGQHGVPGDVISSWRTIPPSRDIPYVTSVQDDVAMFWGTRQERVAQFPSLGTTVRSAFEATATVPISDGGAVVGVAGLMWIGAQNFATERRDAITAIVQRVAPLLLRNAAAADPELDWLNTLLRLHLDPWLLLETLTGADGVVRDFVVQDVALQVEGGDRWIGRRYLELWPSTLQDGTRQALVGLAQSGGSWTMTVAVASGAPWGIPGSRVRAVRLGRRIVVVWRPGRRAERRSDG